MTSTTTDRRTVLWEPGAVFARAFAFGTLSGAACGLAVLLVWWLGGMVLRQPGSGADWGEVLGVLVIYCPAGLIAGATVGMVDGFVVGIGLGLAGAGLLDHLGAARVLAATLAVAPIALTLTVGVDGWVVLGCATAAALGAAYWTRRILGMMGA